MFTQAYHIGNRIILVAYHGGWCLAIADYFEQRVITVLNAKDMSGQAFDLSVDGSKIVTGHDGGSRFRVWSVADGRKLFDYGKPTAARVRFDATGEYVLTWAWKRCKQLFTLRGGKSVSVRALGDLSGAYLDTQANVMYTGVDDRPNVYSIAFSPVKISSFALPHKEGIYTICRSPVKNHTVFYYYDGRIECRCGLMGDLVWSRQHHGKDIVSGGTYNADGKYIAMNVVNKGQTWVLDTRTGDLVHTTADTGRGFNPRSFLNGTFILGTAGNILDAKSGRVFDGPNLKEWWQKAGL